MNKDNTSKVALRLEDERPEKQGVLRISLHVINPSKKVIIFCFYRVTDLKRQFTLELRHTYIPGFGRMSLLL